VPPKRHKNNNKKDFEKTMIINKLKKRKKYDTITAE